MINKDQRYNLEHIDIEITHKCNLACKHCSAIATNGNSKSELSVDEIKEILFKAKNIGLKKVGLTGGEPFYDIDKLKIIVKYCVNDLGIPVHTHSNGTLIDENMCGKDSILPFFESISITFLGANELTHDSITRKKGSFEKSLKGASLLAKYEYPLTCYFIPFKNNTLGFDQLVNKLSNIGVKKIRVMALAPSGRARSIYNDIVPTIEEFNKFEGEVLKESNKYGITVEAGYCTRLNLSKLKVLKGHEACLSALNRVHINSNGDVFPCTAASGVKELRLGNLKENNFNIEEIWNNSEIANKIRLLRRGHLKECDNCWLDPNCKNGCIVNTVGTMADDKLKKCPLTV